NNIPLIIFSVCLIGFGQGSLFPTLVLKALDAVPVAYADQAVAWSSSFTFLWQFLSLIFLDVICHIVINDSIRFKYDTLAITIIIIVVITTVTIFRAKAEKSLAA